MFDFRDREGSKPFLCAALEPKPLSCSCLQQFPTRQCFPLGCHRPTFPPCFPLCSLPDSLSPFVTFQPLPPLQRSATFQFFLPQLLTFHQENTVAIMCVATACACEACCASNNNQRVVVRVDFCPSQRLKNSNNSDNLAPCAVVKYKEVDDPVTCRMVTWIHHPNVDLSAIKWKPAYQGHLPTCQNYHAPAANSSVLGSGIGTITQAPPATNKPHSTGDMAQDGTTPGGTTSNKPAFVGPAAIPSHRALPPLPDKAGRVAPAINLAPINEAFRPDPKLLPAIDQTLIHNRPTGIPSDIASSFTARYPAAIAANMASSFTPINKLAGGVGQAGMPMKTAIPAGDIANAKTGSKARQPDNNSSQVANSKTPLANNKEIPTSQGSVAGEVNKATSKNGTAGATTIKIKVINTRATARMANNNNAGEPSSAGNFSNDAAATTASEASGSGKASNNTAIATTSAVNANNTNPATTEETEKKNRTPLPTFRPNTARVLQATAAAAAAALVPRGGPWSYADTVRLLVMRVRGFSVQEMALVCLSFISLVYLLFSFFSFLGFWRSGVLGLGSLCWPSFYRSVFPVRWPACLPVCPFIVFLTSLPRSTSPIHFPDSLP